MQIVEIRYLWPSFNDVAIKIFASLNDFDHCKKNDHCRFWHNGFVTH